MKLYKYISRGLWKSILRDKLIRFTQPSALNDPFEMMPFYASFIDRESLGKVLDKTSNLEYQQRVIEAYEKLPDEVKLLLPIDSIPIPTLDEAMSLALRIAGPILDELLPYARARLKENLDKQFGVLCLSEVPDHQLMWSNYAESHRGFVIEFDSEHIYFNRRRTEVDEFGYLRKVRYGNRPSVVLTNLDSIDIFSVKGKDWEYEQEWRMLRPLKDHSRIKPDGDNPIYLFPLAPECITGVILGSKMPQETKQEIRDCLAADRQYAHVKIYSANLDDREYRVNVVPTSEV
jgi:hypothetical protein